MGEAEDANNNHDLGRVQRATRTFMANCKAVPCIAEDYAQWLSQYLCEGGKITHFREYPFDDGGRWIMPTVSSRARIPVAYDTAALNIIMLPSTGSVALTPSSAVHRTGWEWGHTQVFTVIDGRAYTNRTNVVPCYPNITPLLTEEAQRICQNQRDYEMEEKLSWSDIDDEFWGL